MMVNTTHTHKKKISTTQEHNELYNFVSEQSENNKLVIIAAIMKDGQYDYKEMNPHEKTAFIMENLIIGMSCELYNDNTDKGTIDWTFVRILKYRAKNIMSCAKGWLYYNCFVNTMSYLCKDIKLLDAVDHFIVSPHGYVSLDQLTAIANKFNVAFRVCAINEKANMIDLCNKQNKG